MLDDVEDVMLLHRLPALPARHAQQQLRGLRFPLGQAFTTPGQEDRHGVIRADDQRPDFKKPLHKFHGFDIRHRGKHGLTESGAGWAQLDATGQRLQRFGHFGLQRDGRELYRPGEPRSPLPQLLDRRGHDARLGDTDVGEGGPKQRPLASPKLISIRPIASRLYAVRHEAKPKASRKYVSSLS